MTLVLDSPCENGVHVLVIGVGGYDDRAVQSLGGAAISARRLAAFWQAAGPELTNGRALSSIDVLASGGSNYRVTCQDATGNGVTVEEPTFARVGQAIRTWAERAEGGGLAILHWIGHGMTFGDMQGDDGPIQALYCKDSVHVPGGVPTNVYTWPHMRFAIEHRLSTLKLFFVDACQVTLGDQVVPESTPWAVRSANRRPYAGAVFRPGGAGEHSYCAPPGLQIQAGLDGGALFTEAIRRSLEQFGVRGTKGRYWANCDSTKGGAEEQLARWKRGHAALGDQPTSIYHQSGAWRSKDAIKLIQRPHGFVDVKLPGAPANKRKIDIKDTTGQTWPNNNRVGYWETELCYGDYVVDVSEKRAFSSATVLKSHPLCVDQLLEEVEINGC